MREVLEDGGIFPDKILIEECLYYPETLDGLPPEEIAAILELAKTKILEINDPVIKAPYQHLIDREAASRTS